MKTSRKSKTEVQAPPLLVKPLKEPTKFYSLFVPQLEWFQKLFNEQAAKGSLSDHLVYLIVDDLFKRKLISEDKMSVYAQYDKNKPEIIRTKFKPKWHSTFSLYIPKKEGDWLREKLDSEYIRRKCKFKSRSLYVWNLLVEAKSSSLTPEELQEWTSFIKKED